VLYLSAIPIAQERLPTSEADTTVADINVKISIILQGRGESQSAIEHLQKAEELYTNAYHDAKNEKQRLLMSEKIIEITIIIANTFVEMGDMEEASKFHKVRQQNMIYI
jgi:tetratricopeptide (TPR) repeat protein